MKLRHLFPELERRDNEIVAAFGQARLVKRLDCRFELRGGSEVERAEAREWISLFLHEAVLVQAGGRG
jgi:hypothetical protein